MATPTTVKIDTIINGVSRQGNVPSDSITVEESINGRVGSCNVRVEDGDTFDIKVWQPISLRAEEGVGEFETYFDGFITDVKSTNRGIQIDYDLTCQSMNILMAKSQITASCSGSPTDILACILQNSIPNLFDKFDFNTLIDVDIDSLDLDMTFIDISVLDAIQKLAALTGTTFFTRQRTITVTNLYRDPSFTNITDHKDQEDGSGTTCGEINVITFPRKFGTGCLSMGPAANNELWLPKVVPEQSTDVCLSNPGDRIAVEPDTWYVVSCYLNWLPEASDISDKAFSSVVIWGYEGGVLNSTSDSGYLQIPGSGLGFPEQFPGDPWLRGEFLFRTRTGDDEITMQIKKSHSGTFSLMDGFMVEKYQGTRELPPRGSVFQLGFFNSELKPYASPYVDGDLPNAHWNGSPNDSTSTGTVTITDIGLSTDLPDADFNIDIDPGVGEFAPENLEIVFPGLDELNTIIITGGFQYTQDLVYVYPTNNLLTHFDLEERVYPPDNATVIKVEKNIGSDGSPTWSNRTVKIRDTDDVLGNNEVLWDKEAHWLEFEEVLSTLKSGFRVTFRHKQRIRVVVVDEASVEANGVQLAETFIDETITSEQTAAELGASILAARSSTNPRVTFTTREPGMRAGQKFLLTARDLVDEELVINRMSFRYFGNWATGYGEYQIEAGPREADLADVFIGQNAEINARTGGDPTGTSVITVFKYVYDSALYDSEATYE